MDQTGLAPAGSFCWNPDCPEYAQIGHHNIRKFGRTARGVQRYQCKMCQQTFTETKGTVFHGCQHAPQTILDCLAMLADRNSLAAIHRIKGVKEETVCEWLQRAAQHVEEIEALLLANHPVSRAQLDALWTYVGHKGEKGGHCEEEARGSFWRGTTIEIESRLRIGRAIAKTEEEVALELMTQLKERGHPETPPAMATDGKGSYREAMLETWGQVPEYAGRGRPPTHKRPGADWHYLQVVKERSGSRLVAVHSKVVYGDPQEVKALLGEHTAYVERTHLTSRQMNGRLVRKSLSYSKQLRLLRASSSWEDWVYNLTRPPKTLRVECAACYGQRRWQARTPAMAAGLTDHVWTVKELLMTVVLPTAINTK